MLLISGRSDQDSLLQGELVIRDLFTRLINSRQDQEKIILAESISDKLEHLLLLPDAFDYPFDSIKKLGKIKSPDKKLRIFTWNLPLFDGTTRYYGFIQHKTDKADEIQLFRLTDKSEDLSHPGFLTLTHKQWYGSLIYEIIEKKFEGMKYYFLLGFSPDNFFISRKIIDLLYFDESNEPKFGKPVFHYQNQMQYRIIFEYSSKVQMSLRWDPNLKMIIYDHLSPSTPANTGKFQFYGPDFLYDGLRFENGVWEVVEDVDIKNKK
jgi:hypothetical protein